MKKQRVTAEGRECSRCSVFASWASFSIASKGTRGRKSMCIACEKIARHAAREKLSITQKAYYEANKDAVKAKVKGYRIANYGAIAERKKKEYARDRVKVAAAHKIYRINNREAGVIAARAWALANPDKRKEISSRHYKKKELEMPGYSLARVQIRRARKLQATPKWINAEVVASIFTLSCMLTRSTGQKFHVDHIFPLVNDRVCGLHVEHNLRIVCAKDNNRKGNRFDPETFDPTSMIGVYPDHFAEHDALCDAAQRLTAHSLVTEINLTKYKALSS